ncbi:MAG TPA: cytochrome c peroxidase [Longimicrobiales bacterium]|nr:cytochrome c peroxidase [Longimicrobiales bacterium]
MLPGETPLGLDAYLPAPEDNPLTPARVALGRRLFTDPILSRDHTRACASCHRPERAFSDSLPVSPGVGGRRGSRHAPALVNRGYGRAFFWDGRAGSLEEAVLQPIANPLELDLTMDSLLARVRRHPTYAEAFRLAFSEDDVVAPAATGSGGPRGGGRARGDGGADVVSEKNVARALASFVRAVRSGDAPVDRWLAGDTAALGDQAIRGRRLFLGKAGCAACHAGPSLTDERFHNTGVGWPVDPGRFAVTGQPEDSGSFKTPTLREVARTAPYMHDGSIPTLDSVVAFYAARGGENPRLDRDIRPFELSAQERRALVAFLEALSSCSEAAPAC